MWEVRLLAGATLLAVLLAMGDNFVLWRWLREVLPLGVMRFPVKALLLAAFTVPLLAAWGMSYLEKVREKQGLPEQLEQDSEPRECFTRHNLNTSARVFLGALSLILVCAFVAFEAETRGFSGASAGVARDVSLRSFLAVVGVAFLFSAAWFGKSGGCRGLGALGLLALLALEPVHHQAAFNPTIPAHAFQPGIALAYHADKGALTPAPKLGESRVMLSPLAERALHTRMVPKFFDDFIGQRLAFWGNLNLLDGLPKVNGASTLVTREWNDVEYFLYGTTNPAPANLMDFLGVTHVTKPGELMQWERRTIAMPLVSAGQKIQTYDDASQSVGALLGPSWQPRETVLIPAISSTSHTERAAATTRVRHFQPRAGGFQPPSASNDSNGRRLEAAGTGAPDASLIEIETEAAAPTVAVIAQNFHPSWRATVNGQPAPVLRANHAFQAIPIPAGKSSVRLDYVDWPFRFGAGISLLTLLGCLVFLRRHAPPA